MPGGRNVPVLISAFEAQARSAADQFRSLTRRSRGQNLVGPEWSRINALNLDAPGDRDPTGRPQLLPDESGNQDRSRSRSARSPSAATRTLSGDDSQTTLRPAAPVEQAKVGGALPSQPVEGGAWFDEMPPRLSPAPVPKPSQGPKSSMSAAQKAAAASIAAGALAAQAAGRQDARPGSGVCHRRQRPVSTEEQQRRRRRTRLPSSRQLRRGHRGGGM